KVLRRNCVLFYQERWWPFSRCSMEPAGCTPCFLTSSNIPMFSQVIATVAWWTCKLRSRKKSSNPLKRKQRNWKQGRSNWSVFLLTLNIHERRKSLMTGDLGSLAGEDFCYLTTTGRVSGRPHTIEIWFALYENTLYMLSGGMDRADWVKNSLHLPDVTVRIKDITFTGKARLVSNPEEDALA